MKTQSIEKKNKQRLIHTSTFSNFLDFKSLLIQKNHASNIKSIFDNSQGINSLPPKRLRASIYDIVETLYLRCF